MKIVKKINLKIVIFIAVKNRCIMHGHVFVMVRPNKGYNKGQFYWSFFSYFSLREHLRTHKVFTKDHCFYLNNHKFSIKSYVLDVY